MYVSEKLFESDFKTSLVKQEFYNSEDIFTVKFLIQISYEELIGGIDNAFSSAFVTEFEPEKVSGLSPSKDIYYS